MSIGKTCAQVAHAAVSAAEETRRLKPEWFNEWLKEGQRKIVLRVKSLDELFKIRDMALKEGVPTCLISDMGLTEIPPGTVTCLGLGPAPEELMDKITGSLALL